MRELARGERCETLTPRRDLTSPFGDVVPPTTARNREGAVTVTVVGAIDTSTAPALRASVDAQLEESPSTLVIDLSRVQFLGAAGLAALVEARKHARARGIHLRLIATTRAVIRPLEVTGLIDLFDIADRPAG